MATTEKIKQLLSQNFATVVNNQSYMAFFSQEELPKGINLRADLEARLSELCGGFYDGSFAVAFEKAITEGGEPLLSWTPQGYLKMAWTSLLGMFEEIASSYEVISVEFETEVIEPYSSCPEGYFFLKGGKREKYISVRKK